MNGYGLFAVMTPSRPEIVVEGSRDGTTWLPYEFKWKPGDPTRRPRFVEPHQPRLDWQMWFAALGTYEDNPWFLSFLRRLLEDSPPVLRLLKTDPFPAERMEAYDVSPLLNSVENEGPEVVARGAPPEPAQLSLW